MSDIRQIIYAPNVHQGGGKVLLLQLIDNLKNKNSVFYIVDSRLNIPNKWLIKGEILTVKPSLLSRFFVELSLSKRMGLGMEVLCMGSLPPLFITKIKVTVYVHNRYLVNNESLKNFSFKDSCRIISERLWLKYTTRKVNKYLVQTKGMANLLENTLGRGAEILPFFDFSSMTSRKISDGIFVKKFDFLYVASGEPHKNHQQLILAWIRLSKLNVLPRLCLTLSKDKSPELVKWIQINIKQYNLNIEILGNLSHKDTASLYRKTKALIYPSKIEAFGLPLIEASFLGLPILSSNLSYVYDVVNPSMTFNPDSFESIASAVETFAYQKSSIRIKIITPQKFLLNVFRSL